MRDVHGIPAGVGPVLRSLVCILFYSAGVAVSHGAASLNDLGIQQVVEIKEKHFGGSAGYRFQILGRSNPFYIEGPVGDAAKAPVMLNTLYVLGEVGNYSMGPGVAKHSAGIFFSRTSYLKELLEVFNHDTQTLFLDNTFLRPGNLAFSAGIRGTRLVNADDGVTEYTGWSPNISIGKLFHPGRSQHLWVRWRNNLTYSNIQGIAGTDLSEDRLNHWSTGLGLTHGWAFARAWSMESHGGLDVSRYSKGTNQDRADTLLSLGTALRWKFWRYLSVAGFVDYTHRSSSGTTIDYDFNNWDGGLRFNTGISF